MMNESDHKADQVEIVYYTDPLCCWSWALEPQWRRLQYEFSGALASRYCMGGLLPSWNNYNDTVNLVSRPIQMGPIWMEASHISGMPIQDKIWMQDPPASSYPACIAVKCAFLQSFRAGEQYLRMTREAIMLQGKNIASMTVLREIAEDLAKTYQGLLDLEVFNDDMKNDRGLEAFRKDIQEIQTLNINRFPALIFRKPHQSSLLISGYRPYRVFLDALAQLAPQLQKTNVAPNREGYEQYWGSGITNREIEEAFAP